MKSFTVSQLMSIIIRISIYIFQDARGKTLIRDNTRGQATVERGARFHPIVGLATPSGFTTSHPRAETTMMWDCVSVVSDQKRRLQSFLSAITHSAYCQSSPLASAPQSLLPHALSSCEFVCGAITLALVRPNDYMDGKFKSHPSLNRLPTSLRNI